jgi:hypothetical protein
MRIDIEARQRRIKLMVFTLALVALAFYGGFILMTGLASR